jgi:uncharacterized protein YyaL (SSP411 family)
MKLFAAILALAFAATVRAAPAPAIQWQPWSEEVFARAEREHRYVLLDLEAVWCHWCHVMSETTYQDPKVVALIEAHYIAVRVDQDLRPDIARRYEDYGWPATVVFNAAGGEIVKRRGYQNPEVMASILDAIVLDPSPIRYQDSQAVTTFAQSPLLEERVRKELETEFYTTHDNERGGLKGPQRFIDRDTLEYGLLRAAQGDGRAATMTKQTLDGALALIDPAWGGAYQYSTDADWAHPHFEKIMSMQAENLRLYALAYAQFQDPRYLAAAAAIHRYVRTFLTAPEGMFYTSQDADLIQGEHSGEYFALDDADRRKLGVPRIDTHSYARENGWMIQALATLYAATGDSRYLAEAIVATNWVVAHRAIVGGGFRHDAADAAGPFLEDSLSMGRAFLALYMMSADRAWLERARAAADFIESHFRSDRQPGYVTAVQSPASRLAPITVADENILFMRFANLLNRFTGDERYRQRAEHAMRYLASEGVALKRYTDPGILQAAAELANDPTHLTIVGHKDDAQALNLYRAALAFPAVYRRVEWWDRREGRMANADVQYPEFERAAAFVCTNGACSLPIFEPRKVSSEAARLVLAGEP